jgi:F-type H+-transporting ATPase subunit b
MLYVLLQEAAEEGAKAAAHGEGGINWIKVGFAWFNFAVLLYILIKFGGRSIKAMLKTRHETIKRDLEEARALRVQAEARLLEYEKRLGNIEREIADLMAGIKKEAEAEAARIVAGAEEAAQRLRHDAEFAIKQEGRRLELELRREAAELAVETTRKLLSSKLTDADQRRLAERFVREMAGAKPAQGAGTQATVPAAET